jgi:F-type H+-transporting ATPase subunit b
VELNWTTFVLEIVNFLILVWILKRFLYKPILEAVARRKAAIDKTLSDAKARQDDAKTLEQQYQSRLADWESEKEKLRTGVREEIAAQRVKMMAALQQSLGQEREKARAVEEQRLKELERKAAEEGALTGTQFTARMLQRLASVELEARIVDLVLEDIPLLSPEQVQAMKAAVHGSDRSVKVTSAFCLPATQRGAITQKLQAVLQGQVTAEFQEDTRLLAGLRISIGPWVLNANIEDEMRFFANALRHDFQNQ